MAIIRAQCAFGADTMQARDRFVITPHFKSSALGASPAYQDLADDLAVALRTWSSNSREVSVRLYDAEAPAPNFPKATKVLGLGQYPVSLAPREVALCLSFYSEFNRPRHRGRLYVPATIISSAIGKLPTSGAMNKVADLVPIFASLGGFDIDWGIWSRSDAQFRTASNWWVDNEWDVVRSRGLRGDSRISGTTSG